MSKKTSSGDGHAAILQMVVEARKRAYPVDPILVADSLLSKALVCIHKMSRYGDLESAGRLNDIIERASEIRPGLPASHPLEVVLKAYCNGDERAQVEALKLAEDTLRVSTAVGRPNKAARAEEATELQKPVGDGAGKREEPVGMPEPPAQEVSVEEIDSFEKVAEVSANEVRSLVPLPLPETDIKHMLREIIPEPFDQKDWGGETSDLFSTRVMFRGRRMRTAFLLKGPSVKGPLHIANLGKRGDQGQRLFREPASLYVIQHIDKIAPAVHEHVQMLAARKAKEIEATVYYCFMDGVDLARLLVAYGKIQASQDSA